ncbi:Seven TM Receptor [Caenorhabditis elegans]|uniref:Seven TM Receptor n=1 Tax=Caenorhabditis elegans TaxID=6239 RepID=O17831_CAEEL|nr:Seven TM Receptor [Caenorhabditis elegans]CAB05494.1 Seven TM Receptor [Caenorhabditis elegans]|eukprot:NP_507050.1 Uncharacterized protein CELE_F22B8.3 [Caenorhabditis elegans]
MDHGDNSDSYSHYVTFALRVAQFGFFATTTSCTMLILLTLYGVKRDFGSYKNLLLMFSGLGIVFATTEVLLFPNLHSYKAGYFFYSMERPFGLDTKNVSRFLVFYTGLYGSTICLLSVQFVYRYWAVFSESKLKFFKGWRLIFCIMYCAAFGADWGLSIYYFDEMDAYADHYFRAEMHKRYRLNISEIAGFSLVAYNFDNTPRWRNISCTISLFCIMLIQYTIIIYCATIMYLKMEEKLKLLSFAIRNLHRQFYKTLVIQIFTPTIFLFSPLIFIIFHPLFNVEIVVPTGMFLCAITIYPAADAIVIMYVVTDYRNTIKSK